MVVIPKILLSAFTSENEVVNLGAWYLRIVGISEVPLAISFVLSGALNGAGDTRWPLYISTVGLWAVRIPLAYFMGITLGLGAVGAWWAMTIETFLRAALYILRFRTGRWKYVKV